MPKTMKAARLYAPGDIRVEEVPVPVPGEGWVLVKVTACGVCGSDIPRVMKTGTYRFPTIPGHEFAGEVAALGPGVEGTKGLEEGLRVTVIPMMPCRKCDYCSIGAYQLCESYDYVGSRRDGAFAEYVQVPARNLLALPEGVDFELGAMTDPVAIARHAVKKLAMKPGDRVAVFGVGPIGVFAIQWAKIMGASEVFAVDVFPEKLRLARDLGADCTVNAREEDPVAKILELTGGKGVERTIEFAGLPVTQEQCILAASKL
ncbi:MAG: galactitol-1-phosphate 5-dehydrogenase, partial [Planctomycetota bacterium]